MATNRQQAIENQKEAYALNKDWGARAKECRYRETGDWYKWLADFPAAYFDPNGYVFFATKDNYLSCGMKIRKQKFLCPNPVLPHCLAMCVFETMACGQNVEWSFCA